MNRRALVLKLSGAAFGASRPMSGEAFRTAADQIAALVDEGFKVGVVVGGGNIIRGSEHWDAKPLPQAALDELGMEATRQNARTLQLQLHHINGIGSTIIAVQGGMPSASLYRAWDNRLRETEGLLIVAGGIGRSGVSSDVAAPLLARDIGADLVIMSKHGVDGVYPVDPASVPPSHPQPQRIPALTMTELIDHRLGVMDHQAGELCRDFGLTVRVVGADEPRAIYEAAHGTSVGTTIFPTSRPNEEYDAFCRLSA